MGTREQNLFLEFSRTSLAAQIPVPGLPSWEPLWKLALDVLCVFSSVRGVDSARWPNRNPPCGLAQVDLLIAVIGSAIGVERCGVEQSD